MNIDITNYNDIIDLRDVISRVEELREDAELDDESKAELSKLEALLDECKGCGGDEQWEGDWYPVTLIRESYFQGYAQDLAEDIGAINRAATWPNNCIDWEQAARELQMDYTAIDYDGVTYYCR